MPNKLSQIWQELKRRKVLYVITVYASAAFVTIELIGNLEDPLNLPDKLTSIVIIALAAAFPIIIILSWIFDVTPRGIVKTKSVENIKDEIEAYSDTSNSWRIATYVSVVIIAGLIIFNVISRSNGSKTISDYGKSIAVLPFINDSPDKGNEYFINGTMEDILDNLCKIQDLRVVSRTSVEQYRNAQKPIKVIAEEMKVSYILEGSCQRHENNIKLTIQLIDAVNDKHLWSNPYQREIGIEGYFELQGEIAQLVANEIEAIVTPKEQSLINKVPTSNTTAYDFYMRGQEEMWKVRWGLDPTALDKAEEYYSLALENDSTFAGAYVGYVWVYVLRNYYTSYLSNEFFETALGYLTKAMQYDSELSDAYILTGRYYQEMGNYEKAIVEYDKALEFNPNNWMAFQHKGTLYYTFDVVKSIENYSKAAMLNRGRELPMLIRNIAFMYNLAGFPTLADSHLREAFELDRDTFTHIEKSAVAAEIRGNYNDALDLYEKAMIHNSADVDVLFKIGSVSLYLEQYNKSLKYFESWLSKKTNVDDQHLNEMTSIAFAYLRNELFEKADSFINIQKSYSTELVRLERERSKELWVYLDLAGVSAYYGNYDEVINNLNTFNQRDKIPLDVLSGLKYHPVFNSIRHNPEFQRIVRVVEGKYQAEHERVRQWLDENNML